MVMHGWGLWDTGGVDFASVYAHGFARVAACTLPVAVADPATNAARGARQARACHDEGVAVALFPELCLSGYAIDDLRAPGQPARRGARGASRRVVAASADLLPGARRRRAAGQRHPRLQLRGRHPPRARCSASSRSRRCRPTASSTSGAGTPPATTSAAARSELGGRARCRSAPTWSSPPPTCADLRLHVEICEDMWVPVPPSAEAALAGATVLANLSGSPITVARAEDRRLLVRSAERALPGGLPLRRRRRGGVQHRPVVGRPDDGLRGRRPAGRERALPRGAAPLGGRRRPAAGSVRSGCARAPSTTTGAPTPAGRRRSARSPFTLDPPAGDIGLRRKVDRFPFVPDDVERLAQDCYEAYNIQVSGLEQRLRAIGQPKVVIGVSGGLDSTHALIVAARAMDRLGRPRSDILAYTLPGFATSDHTRGNATRLAHEPRRELRRGRHPAGRRADAARPRPPVLRRRAGLRRDVRERPGRAAHRLPLPLRQPPRRHRARHRRPLRARAGLVHLRRRRPDVALRGQHRGAQDADPAPHPLGGLRGPVRRRGQRDPRGDRRPGDHPRAGARPRRARSRRPPRTPSAPTRCRTSRSSTSCAAAPAQPRSRSWPTTPGPTSRRASGRPGCPRRAARRTTWRRSGTGWRCS